MRIAILLLLLAHATIVAAQEDPGTVLARIFQDEAGHWEGDCVERTAAGIARQAAIFDIVADGPRAHRFRGRYGEGAVAGRSEIVDGARVDQLDGAAAPTRARIVSARRSAADDYRYVVRDDDGRSTVTRMGARQLLVVEPRDAPDRPARICTYLRTGPALPAP